MAKINERQFRDPITRRSLVSPRAPNELVEDQVARQRTTETNERPTGLRNRAFQGSNVGRAVRRSGKQVSAGLEAATGLVGGLVAGENEFSENRLAGSERTIQEANALRHETDVNRLEDVNSFEDVAELVTNFAGEQVGVLGAVATAALAGGLAAGPVGAVGGGVAAASALEGGHSFQDLATDPTIRENLSFREIAGLSGGAGVLSGSLEALPVLNVFKRFGFGNIAQQTIKGSLIKKFGKGLAEQAALEGGTEAIQTVIARTAAKLADENREIFGEEGISEILNATAAGFTVGGGIGGLGALVSGRGSPEADAQDLDQAFNDLVSNGAQSDDLSQLLLEAPALELPAPAEKRATKFSLDDFNNEDSINFNPLTVLSEAATTPGFSQAEGRDALRLVARAAEAIREQVGDGEAVALISNVFIDAGMSAQDADFAARAVLDEGRQEEEAFLDSRLDIAPKKLDESGERDEGDLPDVLFVNEKTSHFLRTRKGELGYAPVNPNFADVDTLEQQIEALQLNDPDSDFSIIPLGDAIADAAREESVPSDQRLTRDLVQETLEQAAAEKANSLPNVDIVDDPLTFLNQFRAIKRVSVPVDQEGLSLRDTDLEVDLKPSAVEVGEATGNIVDRGNVPPIITGRKTLKRKSDFLVKRTQTKRVRAKDKKTGAPIDGKSEVKETTAETVLDAERLTRTMLRKINPSESPKAALTDEAGQAFTAGLLALIERGDFDINFTALPKDMVIFTTEEGRPITFAEIEKSEVGRLRLRYAQLKAEQRKIENDFERAHELLAASENPRSRRNNELRVARMERRAKALPNELLDAANTGKELQAKRAGTVPVVEEALQERRNIGKKIQGVERDRKKADSATERARLEKIVGALEGQLFESARTIRGALKELTDQGINIEPVIGALEKEKGSPSQLRELLIDAEAFSQAAMLEQDTSEPAFSTPKDPKVSAGTTEINLAARLMEQRALLRDTLSIIQGDPFMKLSTMRVVMRKGLTAAGRGIPNNFKRMTRGQFIDFIDLVERRVTRDIVEIGQLSEREARPAETKEGTKYSRSDRPELRPEPRAKKVRSRNKILQDQLNAWTKHLGLNNIRLIDTTVEAARILTEEEDTTIAAKLLDGTLDGFANAKLGVIWIDPRLNGAVAFETLAHELGHIVLDTKLATADLKTRTALLDEFSAWVEEQGRGARTVAEVQASKKGRAFVLQGNLRRARHGVRSNLVGGLTDAEYDYLLDFDEWFADQISRHFSESVITEDILVRSFFKDLAISLQKLWELVRALGSENYKAAQSVEDFVQNLVIDKETGYSVIRQQIKTKLSEKDINEPAGEAGALMALDPYSEATFYALREQLLDPSLLTPEERGVMMRTFYSTKMRRKLRELTESSPDMQELIDRDPSAAAAIGMQYWLAGKLDVAPNDNPEVQRLYDQLMTTFGLVQGHQQAVSIMEALRDSVILNRKVNKQPWVLTRHLRENRVQDIAASFQIAYEHIAAYVGPHLDSSDGWMFATGNPALIQLAQKFHARVGTERVSETYFGARATNIGSFSNAWSKIRRTITTDEDKNAVLASLRNPKATVDPRLKPFVDDTRKLLRKLRDYYVSRGLEIGDRGPKYFPLVLDTRELQDNGDQFIAFLLRPVFKKALDGIASGIQLGEQQKIKDNAEAFYKDIERRIAILKTERARNAPHDPEVVEAKELRAKQKALDAEFTREEQTEQRMQAVELPTHLEIAQEVYSNIVASEGNADVNLNELTDGTTPFMAAMNKRSLQFVFELGTEQDIKDFEQFQSDNLDFVMFTYIRQGVKRAEYVKRFGKDSSVITDLLRDAQNTGATNQQLRHANYYVDAMVGTIGADTNAKLRKMFGRPAPAPGEIIDPTFQKVMSFVMVMQNLAVLSLATLTSLVDPVGILVRTQDLEATAEAFRAGAKEVQQTMRNLYDSDKEARTALRELAEDMGIIEDHMTNEALEWQYGSAYLTGNAKMVNEVFFKAIGLTQWTRMTRVMALAGGKVFIKKHAAALREPRPPADAVKARKRWDMSKRFMDQLDLTPDDVVLDSEGELRILTDQERDPVEPDSEQPGDDFDVRAEKGSEKARDDRVRAALTRMVDESILRPNAAQRPIRASDPHVQLLFHLKSFLWSFHDRILARVASEAGEGNLMPAMYLMGFIPAMIAADWLRDMLVYWGNGNPRKKNWGVADYAWHGAQRSGLNGLSQLLIDAQNDRQFGGVGYESLAGPSVEALGEIPDLFLDNKEGRWRAFTRQLPGGNVLRVWGDNVFD